MTHIRRIGHPRFFNGNIAFNSSGAYENSFVDLGGRDFFSKTYGFPFYNFGRGPYFNYNPYINYGSPTMSFAYNLINSWGLGDWGRTSFLTDGWCDGFIGVPYLASSGLPYGAGFGLPYRQRYNYVPNYWGGYYAGANYFDNSYTYDSGNLYDELSGFADGVAQAAKLTQQRYEPRPEDYFFQQDFGWIDDLARHLKQSTDAFYGMDYATSYLANRMSYSPTPSMYIAERTPRYLGSG